jgi:cellulose synthase/poly-beta-1,6-N-acetylglucosamine synthase-like glycosyltransferase
MFIMLPNVTLIVPAKNEEQVIGNCIDSLLNLDYPKEKMEIIVSIDGSTDETLKICKKYGNKIRLIESSPKSCKAEALNEVIPLAKGEIIGIYDADCIVERNCLREALKHFSNKDVAGVSCTLKSSNKNQNFITKALSIETCFVSYMEHFLSSRGSNSIFFGRNMFIRKAVLDSLGKFDCDTYQEDGDLNIRMRRNGYKIEFESNAVAWTEEPSTVKSFIKQRTRWTRGYWRLAKKHPYRSAKTFFSDLAHGVFFYTSPFVTLTMTSLMILLIMKMNLVFILPMMALMLFNMYLLVRSRVFYQESLKDLMFTPIFFVLGNLMSIIFIKSWFDEKTKKEMHWFKPDRTGLILK